MITSTIVSQATPIGNSAISIVRLSGPNSVFFSKKLSKNKNKFDHLKPKHLPVYINKTKKIDSAIYLPFLSPNSYTGEEVVEISCHGNPIIVAAIIDELVKFGAVLAEPGEYTKRAFLNGKIDLLQAESVGLLIKSRSLDAAEQQSKNIGGSVSKEIFNLKSETVSFLSLIEYELDVSEEEFFSKRKKQDGIEMLNRIKEETNNIINSFETANAYTQGIKVVFIGKPNVGKSTLVNAILNNDKILTSPVPGTTRDVISTDTTISGLPVSLVDTAGLHAAENELEAAGIKKTEEEIANADVIVSVFSHDTQPIEFIDDKRVFLVYNKEDLQKHPGEIIPLCSVSAIARTGIETLKTKIKERAVSLKPDGSLPLITTLRQKHSLVKAHDSISKVIKLFKTSDSQLELVAQELSYAIDQYDITTGITTTNDILDSVFSTFCVGK